MRGLTLRLLGLEPAWPGLLRYPSAVPRNTPLVRPLRAPSRGLLLAAQPGTRRWRQWRLRVGGRRVAAWTADADTDPNARGRSWAAGGQYRALEPDAGPAGFHVAAPRRSDYGAARRLGALIEIEFIKLGLNTKITRSLTRRGPPAQLQRGRYWARDASPFIPRGSLGPGPPGPPYTWAEGSGDHDQGRKLVLAA